MEKIKFSIVIPTRERADTLFHTIATCIAQDYENLDIIVSDNFSQDNTRTVVNSFSDHRIKYINTGRRVSMSHNWEFALGHIMDGWVTIMGDDDGLLPGALSKVADVINKTGCQAIKSQLCVYFWPNAGCQLKSLHSWPNFGIVDNNLSVHLSSGFELRNGHEWLSKLMRGDADYHDLPYLYIGGFVDSHVIKRSCGAGGTFFLSMIPDIYSAIALASVVESFVMLKEPVAIRGVSSHSTGASSLGIGGKLDAAQEFFSEENIPFHSMVAGGEQVKSVEILVYESYLQSTHLNHNFLKIELEDQLGLALSRIMPKYYADFRKYCRQVAYNNEIDMDMVDRKTRKWRRHLFIKNLKNAINVIVGELPFSGNKVYRIADARKFGVKDISGAAILAKAVFLLETRYGNWKFDNFFQSMKKVLLCLSTKNRYSH